MVPASPRLRRASTIKRGQKAHGHGGPCNEIEMRGKRENTKEILNIDGQDRQDENKEERKGRGRGGRKGVGKGMRW